MARNLEFKARLHDPAFARRLAARLSGGLPEVLEQTDTYFCCLQGRLKLREIAGQPAYLVAYQRTDEAAARLSHYQLVPIPDPAGLKLALSSTLGVWGEVRKRREVSLFENVRIHVDQLTGLGDYLEFEAVLTSAHEAARAAAQLELLAQQFAVEPGDLEPRSYSDLVLSPRPSR